MAIDIRDGNLVAQKFPSSLINTDEHLVGRAIQGTDGTIAEVDEVSGHLVGIDNDHNYVHEGELFKFVHRITLTTGLHEMVLTTGAGPEMVHFVGFVDGDEKVEAALYEAPTFTGGTPMASFGNNKNRSSANVPAQIASLLAAPTVTADGTLLDGSFSDKFVPARQDGEWVLNPSTSYLIRQIFDKNSVNAYMGFIYYEK